MILFPKPGMRRRKGPRPTAEEQRHMDKVRALGCVCCLLNGTKDVPAEVHHVRKGVGKGVRNHRWTIPLCSTHHREGPPGLAVHAGEKVWAWDEIVLLHLVQDLLARQTHATGMRRA